jgi:hypothetical protein
MVTAAVISIALSLVAGYALTHISAPATGPMGWGFGLLRGLFWLQALILAAGGGISCVNAIYKEKDQNTFDYQRVTRLSPLELTLGKLFGAPIFIYFICLCFVPLVIFAAVKGQQSFTFVLAAYAVLIIGSIAFHTLALLISLLTVRGSHTTAIIFVLILLWLFSNIFVLTANYLYLAPLSPFYSADVASQQRSNYLRTSLSKDLVFGHPVHHVFVLIIIDGLLTAWFLLALSRNIKRDPDQYELYSPLETFALAICINVILLAFVNWSADLINVQATLLTINISILSFLGLAQLRNRDRTRRILRTQKKSPISWIDLSWPAPFLFITALTACALVFAAAAIARNPLMEWSPVFAIFRFLFITAWLVRDMQFLQWMTLRRGKRPLVAGVMFLTAFYACVGIVLSAFGTFRDVDNLPFSAFFLPTPIYYLDPAAWATRPAIWGAAFVAQWLVVALFILAQRKTIIELAHPTTPDSETLNAD